MADESLLRLQLARKCFKDTKGPCTYMWLDGPASGPAYDSANIEKSSVPHDVCFCLLHIVNQHL